MPRPRNEPAREDVPRYRLIAKAYIDDKLYDPEEMAIDPETDERKPLLINFAGIPGWHMEPVNDAAKAMCTKHAERMKYEDPVLKMAQLTPSGNAAAEVLDLLKRALATT